MFIFKYINDVLFFMLKTKTKYHNTTLIANKPIKHQIIRHYKAICKNVDKRPKNILNHKTGYFERYNIQELSQKNSDNIEYIEPIDESQILFENNIYYDYESLDNSLDEFVDNFNRPDIWADPNYDSNSQRTENEFRDNMSVKIDTHDFYIRFAPKPIDKINCILRILKYQGIYNEYVKDFERLKNMSSEDPEYNELNSKLQGFITILEKEGIPIYNDNIYYSTKQYNIVENLINEKIINTT